MDGTNRHGAGDGLWRINGRRQVLYVKADLASKQQLKVARDFVLRMEKAPGGDIDDTELGACLGEPAL
jgi:hypothetical protein